MEDEDVTLIGRADVGEGSARVSVHSDREGALGPHPIIGVNSGAPLSSTSTSTSENFRATRPVTGAWLVMRMWPVPSKRDVRRTVVVSRQAALRVCQLRALVPSGRRIMAPGAVGEAIAT